MGHDCINCHSAEERMPVLDLGEQPLANNLQPRRESARLYPLSISECPECHLVQLDEFVDPAVLFSAAYPYRQGQSRVWREHLQRFVDEITTHHDHMPHSALDVGANDGTLVDMLLHAGVNAWGNDPVPSAHPRVTICGGPGPFDLVTAFNVLAHVPDLDFFLGGIKTAMAPYGELVVEVPDFTYQTWDTVYHEHHSYFTPETLANALGRRGFIPVRPFEVVPTHGGSIRATVTHE
jgi:hypothetical protein